MQIKIKNESPMLAHSNGDRVYDCQNTNIVNISENRKRSAKRMLRQKLSGSITNSFGVPIGDEIESPMQSGKPSLEHPKNQRNSAIPLNLNKDLIVLSSDEEKAQIFERRKRRSRQYLRAGMRQS